VVLTDGRADWIQRLQNIQNRLHALDPQTYPRTAEIAYAMDPKELEAIIDGARQRGAKLKAFYHSHPNHDAYFSEEDKAFASPFGEPTFPGAAQIVVSIYGSTVKNMRVFLWSDEQKDFVAVPLKPV
jgi:proteasome lid subunit RPN8/RPN11